MKFVYKYIQWHWFFYILFLFDFINKNSMFLISMFLCFALVPKLVPRTVDFHWYRYRILKFWYRDNTSALTLFPSQNAQMASNHNGLHHKQVARCTVDRNCHLHNRGSVASSLKFIKCISFSFSAFLQSTHMAFWLGLKEKSTFR